MSYLKILAAVILILCVSSQSDAILNDFVPPWFYNHVKLCYQWFADGDRGQCHGQSSGLVCANSQSLTTPYRDDTDGRPGGCQMRWSLQSNYPFLPNWFSRGVLLCFKRRDEYGNGQCGAVGAAEVCAPLNFYTPYYRDDTDHRAGGCAMEWRLRTTPGYTLDAWALRMKLCFEWRADGNSGQCSGISSRRVCAPINHFTAPYRDLSDGRPGGCRLSWGILI